MSSELTRTETAWQPNATGFELTRFVTAQTPDGWAFAVEWVNAVGSEYEDGNVTPDEGQQTFGTFAEAVAFGQGLIDSFDECSEFSA